MSRRVREYLQNARYLLDLSFFTIFYVWAFLPSGSDFLENTSHLIERIHHVLTAVEFWKV